MGISAEPDPGQPRRRLLKTVKDEELSPKWLNRNDQAKLMRAVQYGQNLRDITICNFMLNAGLRVSKVEIGC
jgi:site-specific recombinase XerC